MEGRFCPNDTPDSNRQSFFNKKEKKYLYELSVKRTSPTLFQSLRVLACLTFGVKQNCIPLNLFIKTGETSL
jgi:hypothetical protein